MSVLTFTAANLSATEERGGMLPVWYEAGEDLSVGDAVYLDSNNLAWKAIATASATARAVGLVVFAPNFYGETSIDTGQKAGVVTHGPVYGFSGLSQGKQYWVDKTTAGKLNDAAPTSAYQWILAQAIDDQTLFIDPGNVAPTSA